MLEELSGTFHHEAVMRVYLLAEFQMAPVIDAIVIQIVIVHLDITAKRFQDLTGAPLIATRLASHVSTMSAIQEMCIGLIHAEISGQKKRNAIV